MSGYTLVLANEFSGSKLDTEKWQHRNENGIHGKSQIRAYCSTLEATAVDWVCVFQKE
ncbi:MAG: hypothetical protein ACI9JK_001117 [Phycisphaerales bacterium]